MLALFLLPPEEVGDPVLVHEGPPPLLLPGGRGDVHLERGPVHVGVAQGVVEDVRADALLLGPGGLALLVAVAQHLHGHGLVGVVVVRRRRRRRPPRPPPAASLLVVSTYTAVNYMEPSFRLNLEAVQGIFFFLFFFPIISRGLGCVFSRCTRFRSLVVRTKVWEVLHGG